MPQRHRHKHSRDRDANQETGEQLALNRLPDGDSDLESPHYERLGLGTDSVRHVNDSRQEESEDDVLF